MNDRLKSKVAEAVAFRFEDERTDKSLLIALHGEAFFSQLCRTCLSAQIQAYVELHRLIHPKIMAIPTPPSTKYRFNPISEDAQVQLNGHKFPVTADTLTDAQAEQMIRMGHWAASNLIVTVDEADAIRAAMSAPAKGKPGRKPKAIETPSDAE